MCARVYVSRVAAITSSNPHPVGSLSHPRRPCHVLLLLSLIPYSRTLAPSPQTAAILGSLPPPCHARVCVCARGPLPSSALRPVSFLRVSFSLPFFTRLSSLPSLSHAARASLARSPRHHHHHHRHLRRRRLRCCRRCRRHLLPLPHQAHTMARRFSHI